MSLVSALPTFSCFLTPASELVEMSCAPAFSKISGSSTIVVGNDVGGKNAAGDAEVGSGSENTELRATSCRKLKKRRELPMVGIACVHAGAAAVVAT